MEPRQHPVVNQQTQIVHPLRPEEEERSSGFARFVNFVPYYFRKFFTSARETNQPPPKQLSSDPPMPHEINLERILEHMRAQNAIPIRKLQVQEGQALAADYTPLVAGAAVGLGAIGEAWRSVQTIFSESNLWRLNFTSASDAANFASGKWQFSKLKRIADAYTTSLMDAVGDGKLTSSAYITPVATIVKGAALQAVMGISSLVMFAVQVYQLHQVNVKLAEIDSKLRWFETRDCAELISLFKKCTELSKRYASLFKQPTPQKLLDSFDRDLSVVDMASPPIHEKLVIELEELLPVLGLVRQDNEIKIKPRDEVKGAQQSSKTHTLTKESCAKAKPVITKLIWSIRTKLALVALRTARDTQNGAEPVHLEIYQDRLKELQGLTKDISTILRIISEAEMLVSWCLFWEEVDKKSSEEVQEWARKTIHTLDQAVNPPAKTYSFIIAENKGNRAVSVFVRKM